MPITSIADAKLDSIPIVAFTGQVGTPVIGSDAFQETPIVEVCRSVTKHHYLVTDVDDLFTADFTFTFDPTLISYQSISTNLSILTQDGTPLTTISKELAPGEISIAITRLGGAQGGADAVGEHFMARLFLRRLADSGATSLDFTSARFFDSQVQVIPGVQWRGGSIVIQ